MTAAIELKEINVSSAPNPTGAKDQRSFRPNSLAELNAATNYTPLTITVGKRVINIGCGNDVEDIGIILSCYVALWSFCIAFFSCLLKAALDTDEQNTLLFTSLFFFIIYTAVVSGAVYTGQMELQRIKLARQHRQEKKDLALASSLKKPVEEIDDM